MLKVHWLHLFAKFNITEHMADEVLKVFVIEESMWLVYMIPDGLGL